MCLSGGERSEPELKHKQYKRVKEKWKRFQLKRKPWENHYLLNNVLSNFRRHLKQAGITADAGKTLSIHTLRKCACKNWAKVNRNPAITQKLAGNAVLATTLQYYDQVTERDRAEAAAIDKLLKKSDAKSRFWRKIGVKCVA